MPKRIDQHLQASVGSELRGFGFRKVANIAVEGAGQPGEFVTDTTSGANYAWNQVDGQWVALAVPTSGAGPTVSRPATPVIGFSYFDTTLGYRIDWAGAQWVDSNGATV